MTDNRPVCLNISTHEHGKAQRMTCAINGFEVEYGSDSLQAGDKWKCKECGHMIVEGFGDSFSSDREPQVEVKE